MNKWGYFLGWTFAAIVLADFFLRQVPNGITTTNPLSLAIGEGMIDYVLIIGIGLETKVIAL